MPDTPDDNELDLTDDELDNDPAGQETEDDAESSGGADEDDTNADDDREDDQQAGPSGGDDGGSRRPPSRSGRQIAALREERRRQNEELSQLRREMADLRQARQQSQQQIDSRAEQEQLALMSPEERMEYRLDQSLRHHQQQTGQMVFNMQTQQDKAAWDARATSDKLRSKLAADVEREYAACIARGQYLPRENIYIYLVGQRFLSNRGKGDGKSARRVERERVRPSNGRGDVVQERRGGRGAIRTTDDFERRYGDMEI